MGYPISGFQDQAEATFPDQLDVQKDRETGHGGWI